MITTINEPVRILSNASLTLLASNAEVSMKDTSFCSANLTASSTDTALKCPRSFLFPTKIIEILFSVLSLNSFNHILIFSNEL